MDKIIELHFILKYFHPFTKKLLMIYYLQGKIIQIVRNSVFYGQFYVKMNSLLYSG